LAVQEHLYYSGKAKKSSHMEERINKLSIAKSAFGVK